MTSVTDLIINEIANVLGIPPSEVKSKFTEKQLKELYDLSLCEPTDEVGAPFGDINGLPCEEPAPQLLPPADTGGVEELVKRLESVSPTNPVKKCIDAVEQVAKELDSDRDLYIKHSTLYEKLIEYRDNFEPIVFYFEERASEMARILNEFGTILTYLDGATKKKSQVESELQKLYVTFTGTSAEQRQINSLQNSLSTINRQITNQQNLLLNKEKSIPIFTNAYYKQWLNGIDGAQTQSQIAGALRDLYKYYVSLDEMIQVQNQVSQYSQCIRVIEDESVPTSIAQVGNKAFFRFNLFFPRLLSFKLESQPAAGATDLLLTDFPIKNNPLLENQTFFSIPALFEADELANTQAGPVLGKIYLEYYNLLADPLNNFFTLEDRGLTTEEAGIDPRVRGTDSEKKRENNSEFFVKDLTRLQNFYQDFEGSLESKKQEKRNEVIEPAKNGLRAVFRNLAKREVQLLLAIGRVNKFTAESSAALKNIVNNIKQQNDRVAQAFLDLETEIERVKNKADELKPDPQAVKMRLKKQSPECFDKVDEVTEPADCGSVMNRLGIDPLYVTSIREGTDATLPSSNQLCYWVQFAIVANLVGLLPLPNVPKVTQLRYWPVGLTIPNPTGLTKIPLPVIWLPLVALATPMGTVVIFLTINGVFISPIIFFVSSSGFKQHIFTVRGPSPKFGFSSNEESIKPGVQKSVAFLALQEKIQRLSREAAGGVEVNLSERERVQLAQQRNILKAKEKEAAASGNQNKKLRVAREKRNLEQSVENSRLGEAERLQKILDKTESAKDAVEDAKRAIYQRINDLGKPRISRSDSLKAKIVDRQNRLLLDLQKALEQGDDATAAQIREEMKNDGVPLNQKINAIKADLRAYFKRLDFPTITIPKDSSKLEPKPNAIADFLYEVLDFASIYKSNFVSADSLKVRNVLLVELAKSKNKIMEKIEASLNAGELLDIEKDFDQVKKYLLEMNSELIAGLKGEGGSQAAVKAQANKVNSQKEKVKNEKDPRKKADLQMELQRLQVQFSEIFDRARTKEALALTPEVLASLSQLKVDFNPFAPCCAKSGFELNLNVISPTIPIIDSTGLLLTAYVNSLTPQQFKSLVGGKKFISPREMTSSYLGIIKKAVPSSLAIPVPAFNLLALTSSFTGILASLLEVKVPNQSAQPAMPARVRIDLNFIKPILVTSLLKFLENSLPDPNSTPGQAVQLTSTAQSSELEANSTLSRELAPGKTRLDPSIEIVNCLPVDSTTSAISDGNYKPNVYYESESDVEVDPTSRAIVRTPTSSAYSSGNVIASSTRDVLPSFSTIDTDFLSVNPGDLLAVLKNFVDLGFDIVEKALEQFYLVLKVARSAKGVNFNLLESIQVPFLPIVAAITTVKTVASRSSTIQLTDNAEVDRRLNLVENLFGPLAKSPLPAIVAAGAGIADNVVPALPPVPKIDPNTLSFSMVDDLKPSYVAVRALHPLVSQDDIPSWERLSPSNPLFLLFIDQFLAAGADKVGLFRDYV